MPDHRRDCDDRLSGEERGKLKKYKRKAAEGAVDLMRFNQFPEITTRFRY